MKQEAMVNGWDKKGRLQGDCAREMLEEKSNQVKCRLTTKDKVDILVNLAVEM